MGFSLIPSRPFSYVLEAHRELPQDGRPTFTLRHINSRVFSMLMHLMKTDAARAFYVAVVIGLVGWEGVDRDGAPCAFTPAKEGLRRVFGIEFEGGADEASVEPLPYAVIEELGARILEANTLDRDSAKN